MQLQIQEKQVKEVVQLIKKLTLKQQKTIIEILSGQVEQSIEKIKSKGARYE